MIPFGESEQYKKTNEKVKRMVQARTLVKQLVENIPDYQIREWCRRSPTELAMDITLDWQNHKDTLPPPEKQLVLEMWEDVLKMTAREVALRVKNYGK